MAPYTIPADATIETVWSRLTHQRPYVSGVLNKMRKSCDNHALVSVRIGVTGSGQKPYYRIFTQDDDMGEKILGSYYDNHDPLEIPFAQTSNWSSGSMTFGELEDFYAKQIGYVGKRPR